MYVCSIVCPTPYYRFFLLIFMSSGISTSIQPPSSLQTSDIRKRRVSYRFSASPTSGASYKVTFIPQRAGIPQPPTETFNSSSLRTKSGLVPDVTYRIQVVAVKGDEQSAAISVTFTTTPDGKTAVKDKYMSEDCAIRIQCYAYKCLFDVYVCLITARLL